MRIVALLAASALLVVLASPTTGATVTSQSRARLAILTAADWTTPSVHLAAPPSPMAGTVTLRADASDGESDIASVAFAWHPSGTTTWTEVCVDDAAPYECAIDSASFGTALVDLRVVALDGSGLSASHELHAVPVAVGTPTVVLRDPGTLLRRRTTLIADVFDAGRGATSVSFAYSTAGAGSWTTLCVDGAAPWTCEWDTTSIPDGRYDLRALLLDGAGATTPSSLRADVLVDNTPIAGRDVQTVNATGGTRGRLDPGDLLLLTFNELLDPGSVLAGWNAQSTPIVVQLVDAAVAGSARDEIRLFTSSALDVRVPVGTVALAGDHVRAGKTIVVDATMQAVTVSDGAASVSWLEVRLSNTTALGLLLSSSTAGNLVWRTDARTSDLAGNGGTAAEVVEQGPLDVDF